MSKNYKHYASKTLDEMDDNAKTLTSIRAEQQAETLLGMRPDQAKAEYCYLLGKVLQDRAAKVINDLSKSKNKENEQTKGTNTEQLGLPKNSIWD